MLWVTPLSSTPSLCVLSVDLKVTNVGGHPTRQTLLTPVSFGVSDLQAMTTVAWVSCGNLKAVFAGSVGITRGYRWTTQMRYAVWQFSSYIVLVPFATSHFRVPSALYINMLLTGELFRPRPIIT